MERQKKIKGFTLVELVMVMVIIGLLAAIVVPNFSVQRTEAKVATTKANLESLRTATKLFHAKTGNWPLSSTQIGIDLTTGTDPYLNEIPADGFSDPPDNSFTDFPCTTDGAGWCYDPPTGRIFADLPDGDPLYGNINWSLL